MKTIAPELLIGDPQHDSSAILQIVLSSGMLGQKVLSHGVRRSMLVGDDQMIRIQSKQSLQQAQAVKSLLLFVLRR